MKLSPLILVQNRVCRAVALAAVFSVACQSPAHAATYTWMDNYPPAVHTNTAHPLLGSEVLEQAEQRRGVAPSGCTHKTYPVTTSGDEMRSDCWYDTALGWLQESGFLLVTPDSPNQIAGYINDTKGQLLPTKNPSVFLEVHQDTLSPNGYVDISLRTTEHARMHASGASHPADRIWYAWTHQPDLTLSNIKNSALYNAAWMSDNLRWLSIWDPNGSFTSIDLSTFSARTIQFPQAAGVTYTEIDISPNGSYAVVAPDRSGLSVVDLTDCTATAPGTENCAIRDLKPILESTYGMTTYMAPEFPAGNKLQFFSDNAAGSFYQHTLEPAEKPAPTAPTGCTNPSSGIDIDQDGIDDACDTDIRPAVQPQPPVVSPVTPVQSALLTTTIAAPNSPASSTSRRARTVTIPAPAISIPTGSSYVLSEHNRLPSKTLVQDTGKRDKVPIEAWPKSMVALLVSTTFLFTFALYKYVSYTSKEK